MAFTVGHRQHTKWKFSRARESYRQIEPQDYDARTVRTMCSSKVYGSKDARATERYFLREMEVQGHDARNTGKLVSRGNSSKDTRGNGGRQDLFSAHVALRY